MTQVDDEDIRTIARQAKLVFHLKDEVERLHKKLKTAEDELKRNDQDFQSIRKALNFEGHPSNMAGVIKSLYDAMQEKKKKK